MRELAATSQSFITVQSMYFMEIPTNGILVRKMEANGLVSGVLAWLQQLSGWG